MIAAAMYFIGGSIFGCVLSGIVRGSKRRERREADVFRKQIYLDMDGNFHVITTKQKQHD